MSSMTLFSGPQESSDGRLTSNTSETADGLPHPFVELHTLADNTQNVYAPRMLPSNLFWGQDEGSPISHVMHA
ncbi:hypothetical protein NLI96_g12324 [Meripilus lineatus]|uniref:Uncharacterized protein n=1 Tax=Meripilus lineatus TaxID=2056292 RepID=A0AAD5UQB2_9APHY|nr:hypothetical protein NLI96_g12324 [Physisporinus lineatus]